MNFGEVLYPPPISQFDPNLTCKSKHVACSNVPNFSLISIQCHPCRNQNKKHLYTNYLTKIWPNLNYGYSSAPTTIPALQSSVKLTHAKTHLTLKLVSLPYSTVQQIAAYISGVTIGRARRAVHAGPALWGPKICPTLFLKSFFGGKRGPFWNTCTRAHCNLVTPLAYIHWLVAISWYTLTFCSTYMQDAAVRMCLLSITLPPQS